MDRPIEDATTVMDLNDDCLMEIFQYLTIENTFSLVGCFDPRIDNVAYERIAQLKHLTIFLREPPMFTNWQLDIIGRNLKTLHISAGYSMETYSILKYLQPVCAHGSLETLLLNYIQLDEDCQKCILNVAFNLKFLNLNCCQLTDDLLSPILEKCENLRTLSVVGNYSLKCESLLSLNSKYLEELKVEQNDYCEDAIQSFIVINPLVMITVFAQGRWTSKMDRPIEDATTVMDLNDDCLMEIFQYLTIEDTFSLVGCFDSRIDNVAYERIAQLKHLTISVSLTEPPMFTDWQLDIIGRNLKTLHILSDDYSWETYSVLKYLQPVCAHGSLETLILNYIQLDKDCQKCILNVAFNLKFLNLNYCQLTDNFLSPILEKCENLRTLSVVGNYSLKCESLLSLNSKYLEELEVEEYDYCKDAIQSFVVINPLVMITVFAEGRLTAKEYGIWYDKSHLSKCNF